MTRAQYGARRRGQHIVLAALLAALSLSNTLTAAAANDYYRLIGVSRDANSDEIKKAYRRAARRLHPDGTAPDPDAFMELSKAFETLSDDRRRSAYDAAGGQPEDQVRSQYHQRHHYYHHQHHHPFGSGRGWDPRWGQSFFSQSDWASGSLFSNPLVLALAGIVLLNVVALAFMRRGSSEDDEQTAESDFQQRQKQGAKQQRGPARPPSSSSPSASAAAEPAAASEPQHPAAAALQLPQDTKAAAPWQIDTQAGDAPMFVALLPALPDGIDVAAHAAACRPALAKLASSLKMVSKAGAGTAAVWWVLGVKAGAGAGSKGAAIVALHARADRVLRRLLASGGLAEDAAARDGCVSVFAVAANRSCGTCKAAACPVLLPLHGAGAVSRSRSASSADGAGSGSSMDFPSALDAVQGWALSVQQGNVNLRDRSDLLYASLFEGQ